VDYETDRGTMEALNDLVALARPYIGASHVCLAVAKPVHGGLHGWTRLSPCSRITTDYGREGNAAALQDQRSP